MIQDPHIVLDRGTLVVADRRSVTDHSGWRFWGGLLMALAAVSVILLPELRGSGGMLQLLVPAAVAAVGATMVLIVGRARKHIVKLAVLTAESGDLHVLAGASSEHPDFDRAVAIDTIRDLVFGMTRHPLPGTKLDIEAFSVCVRLNDESIVPIIEASPKKAEAYQVALVLAQQLNVPVTQAGLGYQ